MKKLMHDPMFPADWHRFWSPQSGFIGGMICGAVTLMALLFLAGFVEIIVILAWPTP